MIWEVFNPHNGFIYGRYRTAWEAKQASDTINASDSDNWSDYALAGEGY